MSVIELADFLNGSYIGFTGSQGIQGIQGIIGFSGSTGFTGSRGSLNWSVQTANYTASNLDAIIADTSASSSITTDSTGITSDDATIASDVDVEGGSFTITLPGNPNVGDIISIADGNDWSVYPLTVARNGSTIEGAETDFLLDINDIRVEFIYDGTTWQVYANVGQRGDTGFTGSSGDIADVSITDDTATDETRFVAFIDKTVGDVSGFGVSSTKLFFNPSNGQLNATSFNSLSDINFKENIVTIEGAINTVEKLRGASFTWKDTQQESYGVIAQELEEILPELISETEFKSVNYNAIIPFLIEAIKELNNEIKQLKGEINK